MAEFTAGDRVVKMSGIAAGKYGTVNSVREDGTLNVTFDGERMARFCDPERCGKVAANAKFKVGDVVHRASTLGVDPKDLKILKAYRRNVPGIGFVQKYDVQLPDGTVHSDVDERWFVRANSRAANAKFKVGDRAWYKEPSTGEKIEITITGVSGNDYEYVTVDGIKGRTVGYSGKGLYPLNSRACNRASVFEYGVGDTVKLRSGRTGEVLAKYVDKNGDIKIDVDLNGTRFTASPEMIDSVVKNSRACNAWTDSAMLAMGDEVVEVKGDFALLHNRFGNDYAVKSRDGERWELGGISESDARRKFAAKAWNARACNAEITPELKKAYDEWQKAKAKFDKWWNPNRRLSENPPKGADATRKQLDFAAVFKKVTGKLTPNGYGSMTLEQMVDAVSKNAVATNGLSPYGAVSGLLALKWYDKKEDKDGGVMIVRAPFEAVKRYLEQSARNYPYKIAPYGRGWAKVTAPFEW